MVKRSISRARRYAVNVLYVLNADDVRTKENVSDFRMNRRALPSTVAFLSTPNKLQTDGMASNLLFLMKC